MKKLVALSLALLMVLSISVTAFASFPDLEDEKWSWAVKEIDEMSSKNIIAGFPDGTFGPAKGVTKLQSMLLMSRILGFYEDSLKNVVSAAESLYGNKVREYTQSNVSEIAFLLYYGVISESELEEYVTNGSEVIKRYEAAILLTKTAGAEKEVLSSSVTTLRFDDTPDIPASSRRYVNYVNKKGYMKGVSEDSFAPNVEVTRAQMAVMLYRIMNDLKITYITGGFVSYEGSTLTLMADTVETPYTIDDAKAVIKLDGKKSEIKDFPAGCTVVIKSYGSTPMYIDASTVPVDKTVTGTVEKVPTYATDKIIVSPIEGGDKQTIKLDISTIITLGDKKASINSIQKGDTVSIEIKDGAAATLRIASRSETFSGADFVSVSYEPYETVTFKTSNNETLTKALSEDITVIRNGKGAELRELISGDNLAVTLKNDIVTHLRATSSNREVTGMIEEIRLNSAPTITIKSEGKSSTYKIANNLSVMLDAEKIGTIYDLRVGNSVTAKIESNAVTEIKTASIEAAANTLIGTIDNVNDGFNFFYINVANTAASGESGKVQVFIKKNGTTKFINGADGIGLSFSKIKAGDSVVVTGSKQIDGSYVATTVVVTASISQ